MAIKDTLIWYFLHNGNFTHAFLKENGTDEGCILTSSITGKHYTKQNNISLFRRSINDNEKIFCNG
jgi:hypothetical protein